MCEGETKVPPTSTAESSTTSYSPAPPPYLPPTAISSSTPDLASQASLMAAAGAGAGAGQGGVVGVGGSSPDLVSRCVN